VDIAYVAVGTAVPVLTFIGVWVWRMREGTGSPPGDAAERDTDIAQSVTALSARLSEVHDQVSTWSRDLEERDRKLAEHISGLIDVTNKTAGTAAESSSDPSRAAQTPRGGA
jgi:hypothetical protein